MTEATYERLVRHARRVLPPDPALEAHDLVHAAYVKAARWLDAGRPEGEQAAYLTTAIDNLARDRWRQRRRYPVLPLDDRGHGAGDVEGAALARVALGAVLAAVAAGDRLAAAALAVVLHGVRGGAAVCGVTASTVETRRHRYLARARLGARGEGCGG